jgi:hypothetical protein
MVTSLVSTVLLLGLGAPADLGHALDALRAVGPEGENHSRAMAAWPEVAAASPTSLPRILQAMDGAEPLALNWIRAAVDAICERELAAGGALPAAEIEAFILARDHHPRARRLAYEWLARFDPTATDRLLPRLSDDPDVEIRRDFVARILARAGRLTKPSDREAAVQEYGEALRAARDDDQIRRAVARLRELGETVDLQRHFGFVARWRLIGPFDNTGSKGFDVPHPPESEVDLGATYEGKTGTIRWQEHVTEHDYGMVDLNRALGRHKGAIAYALAEFPSDRPRDVEIRLGSIVGWKLWVNGEFLFGHEEYHHGMDLDQFRVRARLRKGSNRILLKLCQNEQTEEWAQDWKFQLRVCDAVGTAVLPNSEEKGS